MKNGFAICFVLALFIPAILGQIGPNQITRFIIMDGRDTTIVGITHDLKTSPLTYDTSDDKDAAPASRVLQQLAPSDFFSNGFSYTRSLTFDYDTENKVAYFGATGHYVLYKINIDGSGLEAVFASEYIYVDHLSMDFENNYAYFSAYSLAYVNRTAILTTDYFSSSDVTSSALGFVIIRANLLTGEAEEVFGPSTISSALVFNNNYNLMFLVSYDSIFVLTMDFVIVDEVPLPSGMSSATATVLYDRKDDVIYILEDAIFYLRYSTQQSGFIKLSAGVYTSEYVWLDTENKHFYFMAAGSSAIVYQFGYEDFDSLISQSTVVAKSMFTVTESSYGLFAIACDGTSVSNCGWNSSGVPTYLVILIVLAIILPCAGCVGFILTLIAFQLVVAVCNKRVLEFPVDPWAGMPLNRDPENGNNNPEPILPKQKGNSRVWRAQDSSFPPIEFSSNNNKRNKRNNNNNNNLGLVSLFNQEQTN